MNSLLLSLIPLGSAITILAATDHFNGPNELVTVESSTGKMSTLIGNFSTWDIPDAGFDEKHNVFYAVKRINHGEPELHIVGYNSSGSIIHTTPLDPAFAPNNLDAPNFDSAAQKLYLSYSPYPDQRVIEVDIATGKVTKSATLPPARMKELQQILGADAFDPVTGKMYQLWSGLTGQVMSVTDMHADPPSVTFVKTDIENENFLETPVFFNGKIYGFMATPVDPGRTLSYLDPASGRTTHLASQTLAHGIGGWYSTIHKPTSGAPVLYASNTTNGGPGSPSRASVIEVGTSGRKVVIPPSAHASRANVDAAESTTGDDDGFIHTHSSLAGFNLETGALVEISTLNAPITWMNALN
jgi:hypothetical protein